MKLNKVNDWMKILGAQLFGGILALGLLKAYTVFSQPIASIVLVCSGVLLIAFYACAGKFLKNVKTYKFMIVYAAMILICEFVHIDISVIITGLKIVIMTIFENFMNEIYIQRYGVFAYLLSVFITPAIVYAGMRVGRYDKEEKHIKVSSFVDWIKIFVIYIVTGFIALRCASGLSISVDVLLIYSVLLLVIYALAGILLKNIEAYKVAIAFIILPIMATAFPLGKLTAFLGGGGLVWSLLIDLSESDSMILYILYMAVQYVTPFIITYVSMIVAKRREAKLQPYLDEIMKKNEEKSK